ncbi:uncharacterized protein [Equus caballus]|uniref:uncharacterized protein isoform X7 n=1 Tax=Equus caballus TaxID=9796 RepID=UPI0038B358BE
MGRARVALSLARGSSGPSAPRTQLPCPWARPATSYRVTLAVTPRKARYGRGGSSAHVVLLHFSTRTLHFPRKKKKMSVFKDAPVRILGVDSSRCSPGASDLQGRGCGLHGGGAGAAGLHPEAAVPGRDAGELQEPALSGTSTLETRYIAYRKRSKALDDEDSKSGREKFRREQSK